MKQYKILDHTAVKNNENLYNRILERIAVLRNDDVKLLNSICNALMKKLET